ncbi:MAG: tricarballylate utilization 4Fe-4S protein TcuB [Acetobacteraceae bacterium]|nr:tricarballylate utilization 4Fe-4S protein TcuB [Acetobacteraceae bacterium]
MQTIDLTRLASDPLDDETPAMVEARRAMEVCNACRYCEGFCAVFPAMELRREFATGDLNYLANLCHACRGCYYACQYAPPHEFGINVPRVLAEVRAESYAKYAWPRPLARLYERNGLVMALAMAGGIGLVFLLTLLLQQSAVLFAPQSLAPGRGFYDVIPYGVMVTVASITFLFSLLALAVGFARFWADTGGRAAELTQGRPLWQAFRDAATLRYLGGAGHGCNDRDESFSTERRHYHHLMAYGFLLCFASTSMGTVYDHFLNWPAPYPFWSLPVLLGTVGGIGLIAGTAGLFWIKLAGDHEPQAAKLLGADAGLLLLLLLIGVTGLLLLSVRATGAMGSVLAVHLGLVLAFFVTMPYSKFVHGLYRTGALIRHAIERPDARLPKPVATMPGSKIR